MTNETMVSFYVGDRAMRAMSFLDNPLIDLEGVPSRSSNRYTVTVTKAREVLAYLERPSVLLCASRITGGTRAVRDTVKKLREAIKAVEA